LIFFSLSASGLQGGSQSGGFTFEVSTRKSAEKRVAEGRESAGLQPPWLDFRQYRDAV